MHETISPFFFIWEAKKEKNVEGFTIYPLNVPSLDLIKDANPAGWLLLTSMSIRFYFLFQVVKQTNKRTNFGLILINTIRIMYY